MQPGSGRAGCDYCEPGGGYGVSGNGGGAIRINVSRALTLYGSTTANGGDGLRWEGAGSDGSVYINCNQLAGTNGILQAKGGIGSGGASPDQAGGGGRIAVWRIRDMTDGTIQTDVSGGTGPKGDGEAGTVVWGSLPPAGTIIRIY